MNSFILFVGNIDNTLSDQAKKYSQSARLIEKKDLIHLDQISVGYISVGDHDIKDFIHVLDQAFEIYYVPTNTWDDDQIRQQTEICLRHFSHQKIVHNLNKIDLEKMLALTEQRKNNDSQIWVSGCSFTTGYGIKKNQTYGHLIGEKLKLPVSFLAKNGSSIEWAADQILRSDIKQDDILIWGLTGVGRFTYYDQDKINHVNLTYYDLFPKTKQIFNQKLLISDHMLYSAITAIERVINYAHKINCKLSLILFPLNAGTHQLFMQYYLSQFDFCVNNYFDSEETFIDYATDQAHPGPKQHQYYANLILKNLKNENIS